MTSSEFRLCTLMAIPSELREQMRSRRTKDTLNASCGLLCRWNMRQSLSNVYCLFVHFQALAAFKAEYIKRLESGSVGHTANSSLWPCSSTVTRHSQNFHWAVVRVLVKYTRLHLLQEPRQATPRPSQLSESKKHFRRRRWTTYATVGIDPQGQ